MNNNDSNITADTIGNVQMTKLDIKPGYNGFFKIRVAELEHAKFDGTSTGPYVREIFERGNAVAILPYDPVTDKVLLIRQFLIGAMMAKRPNRPLQVIAGMVEEGESFEDVAHREAVEEAGVAFKHIELAQGFLPSPGGSSEYIQTFVGHADLSNAGGNFGLDDENEDSQADVVDADEAIAMLSRGEIEAGPAVVVLLWFALNRDRLRTEWLASQR